MCDAWVALPAATAGGEILFAKNSDRPSFDCQPLVFQPRRSRQGESRLTAQYISLDQAPITHAHLGCRPYWCFGYESGINEHGVVIGNEAIFTRTARDAAQAHQQGCTPPFGLLGMDLVRLALERTRAAAEAVELIGALVERHGQFGCAVPGKDHATGGYDNSFIVADRQEAWVLETAGRQWAARRFTAGFTSISNQPTLRAEWDRASPDLLKFAVAKDWWGAASEQPFDFAAAYADEKVPRQVSHPRLMRSRQLLQERSGRITPAWMKRIARDHYEETFLEGPLFDAADPDLLTLCMHDSPAGFTWGNTASSCVAVLSRNRASPPIFWWTPGPPCNGCYIPVFVAGGALPLMVSTAGRQAGGDNPRPPAETPPDEYSAESYWWLFHRLVEATKGDATRHRSRFRERNLRVRERFDRLESEFERELPAVLADHAAAEGSPRAAAVLSDFTRSCVERVVVAVRGLTSEFSCG